jgi:hypothetical protein
MIVLLNFRMSGPDPFDSILRILPLIKITNGIFTRKRILMRKAGPAPSPGFSRISSGGFRATGALMTKAGF